MIKDEKVYPVSTCFNCQTLNSSNNEFCLNCGVFLLLDELFCSKCSNPFKKNDVKCYVCGLEIKEGEAEEINWEIFYPEEKQIFTDILTDKKGREYILQEYGEKGFDTFTGYLDWEFLDLFDIVEEELKFLPSVKILLSDDAPERLLSEYSLVNSFSIEEKVKKLADKLNEKVGSSVLLQPFHEVRIIFSIVAEIYERYFNFELRIFSRTKKEKEELVRILLRTLLNFYSTLIQKSKVKDEANIVARKLIIFISLLDELTFCHDLGDTLSEGEYDECNHIINERIIRAAMLDEIYKKKRKQQEDKKKLRNVCREIIADLGRALYLQWVLNYDEVEPILNTLIEKVRAFIKEEVDLPYEKIIKQTKESFPYVYLRGEEVEEEKKRGFLEKIRKLEEYLKEYEKGKMVFG
ncbi:MAG: zinc ribbon domain-containing protein [Candidatus Heimdallarchaeota archaeon]|nr:zinc ribbon domain-containing protein [Candidatus Heimdallarchaeota archaeon]MCK4609761.1 zinc ribbon domain-containing protein [Candidatus Heimdallarchaeota archaeon]